MEIIWHGHAFFEIRGKGREGEKVVLALDPYSKEIGFSPPKVKADIVLISHSHYDHNNLGAIKGAPFVIDSPGEYEVKGVFITGIQSFHDKVSGKKRGENVIYVVKIEDIKVCHFGDFGEGQLSSEKLDQMVGIDILLIPVGGVYTISGQEAAKIAQQIEPKIVIPMHYKIEGLKIDIEDEKKFLQAIGREPVKLKKLKIKKSELEKKETMEVVILEKM